jgi:peptide/nickel transport system ATP-binding protein
MLPRAATVESGTATVTPRHAMAEYPIDLLSLSARDLRRFRWQHIAYVPQGSISALNPIQRISRHFRQTAQAHQLPTGVAEQRAHELLSSVHLDPERIWNAYPHELSGGTRQRVAIALAMLLEPSVIILDEPTTALDVLTQEAVLRTLLELQEQTGVSYLAITHDLSVAAAIAHDVVTMYAGRAVEHGPADLVFAAPVHPYTRGLMASMPSVDSDVAAEPIGGYPPNLATLPPGCAFHPRCAAANDQCREGAAPELVVVHDRLAACPVVAGRELTDHVGGQR